MIEFETFVGDLSDANQAQCHELRGERPSGDDVILIAKRFMSDAEPYKVQVLLSASQCTALRRG